MSVVTTQWEDAHIYNLLASFTPGGQGVSIPEVEPEDFETFADWIGGSQSQEQQQSLAEAHLAFTGTNSKSPQSFIDTKTASAHVQYSPSKLFLLNTTSVKKCNTRKTKSY